MIDVRYFIDPETDQPHIYGHGVSEDEVEDVLASPNEDRAGNKGSRIAIGQTRAGRYLKVIYSTKDDATKGFFVITAYDLTGKQLAAFRRRRRGRWQ